MSRKRGGIRGLDIPHLALRAANQRPENARLEKLPLGPDASPVNVITEHRNRFENQPARKISAHDRFKIAVVLDDRVRSPLDYIGSRVGKAKRIVVVLPNNAAVPPDA